MTEQHLLTDQEILIIAIEECGLNDYVDECVLEDSREEWEKQLLKFARIIYQKGSDDRLEQVIEWLQANLWLCDDEEGYLYITEDFLSDKVIDEDKVINDLKKAMRPQENNNG